MKIKKLPFIALFLVLGFLPTHPAHAGTVSVTIPNQLYYWVDRWSTNIWSLALGANAQASIFYGATVYDNATGAVIPANGQVSVGQVLRLVFTPHSYSHISWFGTGYSDDSPYGDWVAGAPAPSAISCLAKDFVNTATASDGTSLDVYIPFEVNPPTETLSSTSGLSCNAASTDSGGNVTQICTVTSAGGITPTFNFAQTYGTFYYRYHDPRDLSAQGLGGPGCYGNNVALASQVTTTVWVPQTCGYSTQTVCTPPPGQLPSPDDPCTTSDVYSCTPAHWQTSSDYPQYNVTIPAHAISYPLTSIQPNRSPLTPSLTCPASGQTGQNLSFTVSGTDPDSDQIRYGIDWTNAFAVNQWVPASGYVPSGTAQTVTHSWATPGTYVVRAISQEVAGSFSGWSTSCSVTITAPPPPPATALLTATPSSIAYGGSATLQWSSSNATSCTGTGFSTGGASSGSVSTGVLSSTQTYSVTCTGAGGTSAPSSATVTVGPAPQPDLTAGSVSPSSATAGQAVTFSATISNNGNGASGSFPTRFQIYDNSLTNNIANPVSGYISLSAGASSGVSASYTFASPGTYQVRACANQDGSGTNIVSESNFGNNCGAWTAVTVGALPPAPASMTATCNPAGTSVTLSWPSASGATSYYPRLGGNPIQPQCGQAGWQVWTDGTTCYPNPDTWPQTSATLPVNPGQSYNAWVHSGNAYGVNWNAAASTNFMCVPVQADLTAGSVNPSSATAGQAVTFSATAFNTGNGDSSAFPTRFQIYDNSLSNNIANPVSGYISLVANSSSGVSASYTFASPGTYQVRACANQNGAGTNIVTESNYGNNCGPWTVVTVSSPPPSSLTCTVNNASPTVGQSVTYTANGGNAGDTYSWSAADGWSGTSGVTASTISRTFTTAGTYGMQVVDSGVTANCPVVNAGNVCTSPTATISANPTRVRSGSTSTISWNASGITTSCTITGPGVNQTVSATSCTVAPSSITTPPITAQSVYTISCDGSAATNQVIVNVIPSLNEF